MESKSGVCTKNTYVKSAKNRGEILVPGVCVLFFTLVVRKHYYTKKELQVRST